MAYMALDWNDLLVSYLHDPPDKALDIRGHESRAASYAGAAVSREVTRSELHGLEDQLAAIAERLPMPTAGASGERGVSAEDGRLPTRHPISGHELFLSGCELDARGTLGVFNDLASGIDDPRVRFLTYWRLLRERLTHLHSRYDRLPADTRLPDHTIWNHMDIAAGLRAALSGTSGMAFLSFALGPVQPFIASARSVRDLWTGSAILSWLTFQGMLPVVEELGPTAVVFPALCGAPFLDLWLRAHGVDKVVEPGVEQRLIPAIPNRFLAVVPWGPNGSVGRALAKRCEDSARDKWKDLTEAVRAELRKQVSTEFPLWDALWSDQVEHYFDIRTALLPERDCGDREIASLLSRADFASAQPNAAKVRGLADALPEQHRPSYDQKSAGRWQAQVQLSARVMEALRAIRHVPPSIGRAEASEQFPAKCSLMGSYEQMGPAGLDDSRNFWQEAARKISIYGVRLRSQERFCAIALTKRFAAPAFFAKELGVPVSALRFPDTATVAAAEWLEKEAGEIDPEEIRRECGEWSGQWLHWPRQDFDRDDVCPVDVWERIKAARSRLGKEGKPQRPPAYYSILAMDGDNLGQWLRGEKAPTVREVLHSRIREYYGGLPQASEGLNAKRPLGPALHMALSEALTNFALRVAPPIVQRHFGTLIYSGGDDLLALLPTRTALACADELKRAYRGERTEIADGQAAMRRRLANNGAVEGYYRLADGREALVMGPKATISAGLAVVHYKEDLRQALTAARDAMKAAKRAGRDALQLAVCRRSGAHDSAPCDWNAISQIERWVEAFASGASDRWAYHLRAEVPTLEGLPLEAIQAEIRRQVGRAEDQTRSLLAGNTTEDAGALIAKAFDDYRETRSKRAVATAHRRSPGREDFLGPFLRDFITLVQSASFLARGRENE
jgi:CRISPR-associated protein Cmr2